jgi:hypothetical protein
MLLRKISLTAAMLAGGAFGALAACGDDGDGNPDARRFDAPIGTPDGMPDATPAASYVGTLSILEAKVYVSDGSGGAAVFGAGPSFRMAFVDPAATGAPVMEEMPGSPFGCKAFEYTPAQFAATLGDDLGTIGISFTNGVVVPTCGYTAGQGYTCPDPTTAGNGDNANIAPGPAPGLFAYVDADSNYTADVNGRYLLISGATPAANNGLFPIVAVAGATTLVYANPAGSAGANVGGTSITIAGVGPIPQSPGFIADNATVSATFTSANTQVFENFTGAVADFANDFTLDTANAVRLFSIPTNGTEITLDCDANSCADSLSRVVNIQTTDTPVAGLSPFAMPPPTTKAVLVRCTSVLGGPTGVTIPAAYSAFIQSSGATRIQTTMVSGSLATGTGLPNSRLVVLGGHSAVGFTTVPPPAAH